MEIGVEELQTIFSHGILTFFSYKQHFLLEVCAIYILKLQD